MLDGKVVIITGAGGALGAATARACASEGASVVLTDVNDEALREVVRGVEAAGGDVASLAADISEWNECQRIVAQALNTYGRLDGLVNNAAIAVNNLPLQETEAQIRRHFEVNVYGTFFLSILAGREMAGSGSIVNVISGAHSGMRFSSVYGSSKGAVASLTYCWAADLAAEGSGIRVNAFSPHAKSQLFDAGVKFYSDYHGAGLNVDGPDSSTNAPVVVYLLSDLSGGVNGQVLRMEGGTQLSLNTHPAILNPPLYRETWTPQDVAAAFDEHFNDLQLPCGLTYLDASVVPAPTARPTFEPTR